MGRPPAFLPTRESPVVRSSATGMKKRRQGTANRIRQIFQGQRDAVRAAVIQPQSRNRVLAADADWVNFVHHALRDHLSDQILVYGPNSSYAYSEVSGEFQPKQTKTGSRGRRTDTYTFLHKYPNVRGRPYRSSIEILAREDGRITHQQSPQASSLAWVRERPKSREGNAPRLEGILGSQSAKILVWFWQDSGVTNGSASESFLTLTYPLSNPLQM
jgi:hypothetical protein